MINFLKFYNNLLVHEIIFITVIQKVKSFLGCLTGLVLLYLGTLKKNLLHKEENIYFSKKQFEVNL